MTRHRADHGTVATDRKAWTAEAAAMAMGHDGQDTGMAVLDEMGPVDYLVIEFPECHPIGENVPLLVDLVDRGIIRILDLALIKREYDGSVSLLALADADGDGEWDYSVFEGVSAGLLGEDDIGEAAQVLEPGRSAALLVYENRWAAPLAVALRRGGAQLVSSGRIPVQAILASLDAIEPDAAAAPPR
jgi:hypothetical protein